MKIEQKQEQGQQRHEIEEEKKSSSNVSDALGNLNDERNSSSGQDNNSEN